MAQLVAALITVHSLLSFLSDVYGFFDSSGKTLWLSVDHRRLRPVDDMVLLSCVVCDSGRTFARSLRASSLTERNKSVLIDHATRLSIFFKIRHGEGV